MDLKRFYTTEQLSEHMYETPEGNYCQCGCGTKVKNRFAKGHYSRVNPPSKKGRVPWNKGLGKETDIRVCHSEEAKEKIRKNHARYWEGKKRDLETNKKVSDTVLKLWTNPEYREKRSGVNNPLWKGGISKLPYTQDWTEDLRDSIRKRDKYICQICFLSQDDQGRKLDVHHIDYDKENCDPYNLISLCDSCHARTGAGNREMWKSYLHRRKIVRRERRA
jgi:hypothetical protein